MVVNVKKLTTDYVVSWQIDAFQHMQHFVQGVQQQAQHAIAAEDHQRKQELHKLMARSVHEQEAAATASVMATTKAQTVEMFMK